VIGLAEPRLGPRRVGPYVCQESVVKDITGVKTLEGNLIRIDRLSDKIHTGSSRYP
jgi:hypothetical protein